MKTNTLLIYFFCTCMAITSVITGAIDIAFAENYLLSINQPVLNGLYSPTTSERFFKQGNRNIEREIQILTNPERYKREVILQNNGIEIKRIEETGETNPNFHFPEDSLQQELNPNTN